MAKISPLVKGYPLVYPTTKSSASPGQNKIIAKNLVLKILTLYSIYTHFDA